jgi:HK97 family phage major capsid protein
MTIDEIEVRLSEIKAQLDNPEADLTALEEEVRSLNEQREALKQSAKEAEEKRKAIANGIGETKQKVEENKPMTLEEIRNSKAYIDAYAEYIKSGDQKECRALLTQNAQTGGQLPVPVLVDEIVRTAWERDGIMSRVRKTYFRGNLKVAYEMSADGALVHLEGDEAVAEEDLQLGIVTLIPANVKKLLRLSDEAVAMGGEAFLRYVYDELTYQIVKKLAALIVADIVAAPAVNGRTAVGVPVVSQAAGINTIATAAANLSDEATDAVVIMNRLSEVNFRAAYAAGNFAVDPFAGLPRVYTSALKAYDAATTGEVYAIVGDLSGAQVNYPEGDGVVIKYDELTEADADMVKVVGRQYAAHGVTAPGRFVKIAKA